MSNSCLCQKIKQPSKLKNFVKGICCSTMIKRHVLETINKQQQSNIKFQMHIKAIFLQPIINFKKWHIILKIQFPSTDWPMPHALQLIKWHNTLRATGNSFIYDIVFYYKFMSKYKVLQNFCYTPQCVTVFKMSLLPIYNFEDSIFRFDSRRMSWLSNKWRRFQHFVFISRQGSSPRSNAQRVSISRHQGRHGYGHRQRWDDRGIRRGAG